jgi:hypothetical protein
VALVALTGVAVVTRLLARADAPWVKP